MATIERNAPIVQHVLRSGGTTSVTVPSGEVWKVTIHVHHGTDGNVGFRNIDINGVQGWAVDEGQNHTKSWTADTVLTGGDTVGTPGNDTHLVITGREVSNQVGNTPVSVTLAKAGESVTVPSGEQWEVNILLGDDANSDGYGQLLYNNEAIATVDESDGRSAFVFKMTLDGGDTLDTSGVDGCVCHIGGFKV